MKKPFLFLILLCLSLLSFSQKEISNETHPFQVLFVDSVNYIGKNESVKQFDFLSINDSLQVEGEIVLVHFTGKISILNDLKFSLEDLAKIRFKEGPFERPIISNRSFYGNKLAYRQIDRNLVGRVCVIQPIEIVYPFFNGEEIIVDKSKNQFHVVWEVKENYASYVLRFVDIFDEELFKIKTDSTNVKIPIKPFLNHELIIGEIKVKDHEETSGAFAVRFQEPSKTEKFEKIIDALEEQWVGNKYVAQILFLEAINQSNQDPRFIQLYEDFLTRNPQFKNGIE